VGVGHVVVKMPVQLHHEGEKRQGMGTSRLTVVETYSTTKTTVLRRVRTMSRKRAKE